MEPLGINRRIAVAKEHKYFSETNFANSTCVESKNVSLATHAIAFSVFAGRETSDSSTIFMIKPSLNCFPKGTTTTQPTLAS